MKILVATNNFNKQQEFSQILSGSGVELVFPSAVGLANFEVEEVGQTIEANSALKAREFATKVKLLTVADDSGLEVDFLQGEPGVRSKRFAVGSDEDRCRRILELMATAGSALGERQARFKCVLTVVDPQTKVEKVLTGIFAGSIALQPAGDQGFGYDPIFIPEGEKRTVAELGQAYKNQHSHRAQALKKLAKYLETL